MKRSELFFAFILLPVDIAMIVAGFLLAYYVRIDLEVVPAFSDIGLRSYLLYSLYLMPFWIGLFALNGLYGIRSNRSFAGEFYRILNASSTAVLILIVSIFLSRSLFFSRLILIFTWVFSIALLAIGRFVVREVQAYLFRFGIGIHRVALIGDNSTSESIINYLAGHRDLGYKVKGILNQDGQASKLGLRVTGSIEEMTKIAKNHSIDEIILTDIGLRRSKILELIQTCSDHNITFKYVPDVFALLTTNVSTEFIGSMPVMQLQSIPLEGWGRIVKRILDIILSLFCLIIGSPVILLIVAGIKLTSRGPIIYKQKRVGRDGREFNFYKFRSMYTDKCDFTEKGTEWTTKADEKSRITPFGNILRKTSLDEIPQFVNVLKGDMSFVGPRPELPKFVEQFQKEIPEYFRRHRVKSGITGWAQVNGLKGDTSIKERVKYDIYYIENWSLLFDISVIIKTIGLIFSEIFGGKTEYRPRPPKEA